MKFDEADFKNEIPDLTTDNEFEVFVVIPKTGDSAKRIITIDNSKIYINKNIDDVLVTFKNIDFTKGKCEINSKP